MNAFDEILLLVAFAACFGIAVCLLLLLFDYRKQRREGDIRSEPLQHRDLPGSQSRKRAA